MFNTSEISEAFQNISFIRNINNNNDTYSLLSYRLNDSKKKGSGSEIFSIIDKQNGTLEESLHLSKKATEKQINSIRDHRNSINPTFNIIVNNNSNRPNKSNLNKRVSYSSLKAHKKNFFSIRKKSILTNNNLLTKTKTDLRKRSNSFTESGLFLKQFYSLIGNSKFSKNKHQILKEIQNKISLMKRNNSLKDLQSELKLKNNSPFYKQKSNINNNEQKNSQSNESKKSEHNIHIINNSSLMMNEECENSFVNNRYDNNGGEVLNEFYADKSTFSFLPKKDDNDVFKKLNKKQ